MDIFYTTVLGIALVVLILILTYVGIKLSYNKSKTSVYPPISNKCPDYWIADGSGCKIPSYGNKNSGSLYTMPAATSVDRTPIPTAGLTGAPGYSIGKIDFTHPDWGKSGIVLCNQKDWAIKNGIVWDGVSNYNSCSTSATKKD